MTTPAPIPIPLRERWRDFRMRVLPILVFLGAAVTLAIVWRDHAVAPTLVAQVEPIQANVSCYKAGMLADVSVKRFQKVKAGDPVGQVFVADPKVLSSSLAVIQADIDMLRVNLEPIAIQQRNAINYNQLRLDWMRQRAQLAMAKVNLQLAQAEYRRAEELFREKIASESVLDQAKAAQERAEREVQELGWLVDEQAKSFESIQLTNRVELTKVSDEPLRAAIAAQEARLKLTEAELSPMVLTAPADGMVSMVYRRSGEAITAGEPIVTIAAFNAVRIVGYLRPPIAEEPKVGSQVEVRTRGPQRRTGFARVLEVGTQYEAVAPALQSPLRLANLELGLPIGITMPEKMQLRPGELVDVTILPAVN